MRVLDLFGGTGAWSAPYRKAGHYVQIVDPLAEPHPDNLRITVQEYLRSLMDIVGEGLSVPHYDVVLIAPVCTEFAVSGSRWWAGKDPRLLRDAADDVITAVRIKDMLEPRVWAMENPVGRMRSAVQIVAGRDIGQWRMTFNPCDYAGWADDPAGDAYTKRTCLWGDFTPPLRRSVPITHVKGSSPIHRAPPGPDRWKFRSITPQGFSRAFYDANNW